MEHRWSMRKPVAESITLKGTPLGVIEGSVRDISLGGMYVDTGKKPLPVNSTVHLAFPVPNKSEQDKREQEVCMVPAVVVRTTNEGAGLMFQRFAPSTFRLLGSLLLNE